MCKIAVAPLVGAWIEILILSPAYSYLVVAPLVGAWIEIIAGISSGASSRSVAPLVGAWIEINVRRIALALYSMSLPSWERGLKSDGFQFVIHVYRRSPCGSVD